MIIFIQLDIIFTKQFAELGFPWASFKFFSNKMTGIYAICYQELQNFRLGAKVQMRKYIIYGRVPFSKFTVQRDREALKSGPRINIPSFLSLLSSVINVFPLQIAKTRLRRAQKKNISSSSIYTNHFRQNEHKK